MQVDKSFCLSGCSWRGGFLAHGLEVGAYLGKRIVKTDDFTLHIAFPHAIMGDLQHRMGYQVGATDSDAG